MGIFIISSHAPLIKGVTYWSQVPCISGLSMRKYRSVPVCAPAGAVRGPLSRPPAASVRFHLCKPQWSMPGVGPGGRLRAHGEAEGIFCAALEMSNVILVTDLRRNTMELRRPQGLKRHLKFFKLCSSWFKKNTKKNPTVNKIGSNKNILNTHIHATAKIYPTERQMWIYND